MIIASMATVPGREKICEKALCSIEQQVDSLYYWKSVIHNRMDDARKFYCLIEDGYFFTIDDDIIYPPDYAEKMIAAIEKYDRKAVVTLHGKRVRPPIESYYNGGAYKKYHCLGTVEGDHRVHIPGTGVMAYHSDTIRFSMDDFPEENMADIQAGIKCNALGVPVMVIEHAYNYLTYQEPPDVTIWERYARNEPDTIQTRLVNETKWLPLPESAP